MFNEKEIPHSKTLKAQAYAGDFRLCLLAELAKRSRVNPAFSLRAFARMLGLESSRLSKMLRGHRPISRELVVRIGQRLGLSKTEIDAFADAASARKKAAAAQDVTGASAQARNYKQLSQDAFETIEDWRHYAMLELMKLQRFQSDLKAVAKELKITVSEARDYVERLQRVGLLEIREDGVWQDLSEGFSSSLLPENETSYAHRRSQKKILELGIDALDRVPVTHRDQTSMMMATSTAKIAEAKRRIQAFRRELCEFLEDTEVKDAVYQMSLSLFPLIENTDEEKSRRQK